MQTVLDKVRFLIFEQFNVSLCRVPFSDRGLFPFPSLFLSRDRLSCDDLCLSLYPCVTTSVTLVICYACVPFYLCLSPCFLTSASLSQISFRTENASCLCLYGDLCRAHDHPAFCAVFLCSAESLHPLTTQYLRLCHLPTAIS